MPVLSRMMAGVVLSVQLLNSEDIIGCRNIGKESGDNQPHADNVQPVCGALVCSATPELRTDSAGQGKQAH